MQKWVSILAGSTGRQTISALTDRRAWSARRLIGGLAAVGCCLAVLSVAGLWAYAGSYGLHVLFRHGGTYWITVAPDSPRLSPSMRLAFGAAPVATPGLSSWRSISPGFEVAELPALVDGQTVDTLLLARIDPARFRFEVCNASDGDKDLDQWTSHLGAALVVNGSYYAIDGKPDTPFLTDSVLLGPKEYDARAGAFVTSPQLTGIRDLATARWQDAFQGSTDAMVSYPMLVANGTTKVPQPSRWLANRSFVGQDAAGLVIIGTTTDAFFTLDRFASFLLAAPLGLTLALNLDGGPMASQAITLNGFDRRTYGRWEAQLKGDQVSLLTWPYGTVAMPIVLAVFPK